MIFGKKIKELREEHGMVQRKLAAALDIDTPMYSKIERGERKAKRSHIPIMARLLEIEEKELLTIWLADNKKITLFLLPRHKNKTNKNTFIYHNADYNQKAFTFFKRPIIYRINFIFLNNFLFMLKYNIKCLPLQADISNPKN